MKNLQYSLPFVPAESVFSIDSDDVVTPRLHKRKLSDLSSLRSSNDEYDSDMGTDLELPSNKSSRGSGGVRITRSWTDEEDASLRQAVEAFGENDWIMVSRIVRSRDNIQCRQRWQKTLKPGLHRGKWTEEEDQRLRECMDLNLGNWTLISERMTGRTSKQCRERWYHHLCPGVNKSAFSEEEDMRLMSLYEVHGSQWSRISKMMEGRTESMVRSRVLLLEKKRVEQKQREESELGRWEARVENDNDKMKSRRVSWNMHYGVVDVEYLISLWNPLEEDIVCENMTVAVV